MKWKKFTIDGVPIKLCDSGLPETITIDGNVYPKYKETPTVKLATPTNLIYEKQCTAAKKYYTEALFDIVPNAETYDIYINDAKVGELKYPHFLGWWKFNDVPKGNIFAASSATQFDCSFGYFGSGKCTDLVTGNGRINWWLETAMGPYLEFAYQDGRWGEEVFKRIRFFYTNKLTNADMLSEFLSENAVKKTPNIVQFRLEYYDWWQRLADGEYTFSVVAKAKGYIDSDKATIKVVKGDLRLDTPTGLTANGTVLTWNPVKNAAEYQVSFATPHADVNKNITQTTIDMNDIPEWVDAPAGENTISISAWNDAVGYERSDRATIKIIKENGEEIMYVHELTLQSPILFASPDNYMMTLYSRFETPITSFSECFRAPTVSKLIPVSGEEELEEKWFVIGINFQKGIIYSEMSTPQPIEDVSDVIVVSDYVSKI